MHIHSLVLVNFMCHEHLQIEFGPHITFIVGQNGSGKSAVVAALMVVFGLNAAKTQRGHRLSSLIREGESSFTLIVQIRNDGEETFQYERFGSSITIERRVTADGTSTFRFKDAQQRAITIDRPRELVREMVSYFRLQVDNPLVVLTQEVVKRYLAHSLPAERYDLVMRGSQLQRLAADYEAIEINIGMMKGCLAVAEQRIAAQKQNLKDIQQQIDAIKEARAILNRLSVARRRLAAARHREICNSVLEKETEVRNMEQRCADIETQICQKNELLAMLIERGNNIKTEKEQLTVSGLPSLRLRAAQIASQLGILSTQITNLDSDERVLLQGRTQLSNIIANMGAKIDVKENENTAEPKAKLPDETTLEAELNALDEQHKALEAQLHKREMEMEEFKERETRINASLRMAREQTERMEAEAASSRAAIPTAVESENDSAAMFGLRFGAPLAALMRHLDQNKMDGVTGPLGRFVRLRPEATWTATAMDAIIGRHMASFVVTSYAQRSGLAQLMRRFGVTGAHIILLPQNDQGNSKSNFGMSLRHHDDNLKLLGKSVLTVRGALEITSDAVERALCILASIHRTALCREREEAVRLLQTPGARSSLDMAFLATGQKVTLSTTAQTFFSFATNGKWFSSSRTQQQTREGMQQALTELEAKIVARRATMAQLSTELAATRRELLSSSASMEDFRKKMRELGAQRSSLLATLREAAAQKEFSDATHHKPMEATEDTVRIQQRLAIIDAQLADISTKRAELKQREDALQLQQREATNEIQGMEQQVRRLTDMLSSLEDEQRQLRTNAISALSLELQESKRKVQLAISALEDLQQRKETSMQTDGENDEFGSVNSIKLDNDDATEESVDVALRRVQKLEAAVEAQRRAHGSSTAALSSDTERLLSELRHASFALAGSQNDAIAYGELVAILERSVTERRLRWTAFREIICKRADLHFRMFLAARNFSGRLVFDHDAGTLQIMVSRNQLSEAPHDSSESIDLRGLSGGEKSLVTASLLLALWECVESPLRALDEFDVFMDGINRKTILRMLLEYASKNK